MFPVPRPNYGERRSSRIENVLRASPILRLRSAPGLFVADGVGVGCQLSHREPCCPAGCIFPIRHFGLIARGSLIPAFHSIPRSLLHQHVDQGPCDGCAHRQLE